METLKLKGNIDNRTWAEVYVNTDPICESNMSICTGQQVEV